MKHDKRIAFYTSKIAQLFEVHPSKRTTKHERRFKRLMRYKQAMNQKLKEVKRL